MADKNIILNLFRINANLKLLVIQKTKEEKKNCYFISFDSNWSCVQIYILYSYARIDTKANIKTLQMLISRMDSKQKRTELSFFLSPNVRKNGFISITNRERKTWSTNISRRLSFRLYPPFPSSSFSSSSSSSSSRFLSPCNRGEWNKFRVSEKLESPKGRRHFPWTTSSSSTSGKLLIPRHLLFNQGRISARLRRAQARLRGP